MVDFRFIKLDNNYSRPMLAALWGYASHNAMGRGVFTPKGQNVIVLFVTHKKQQHLTQYEDLLAGDILFMEGEAKGGSDARLAAGEDDIHLFYREIHHTDFTYKGRLQILKSIRHASRPSQFVFRLIDYAFETEIPGDGIANHEQLETEKEALIKSRRGQGLFRAQSIALWKSCCVTGFSKQNILVASHVKPWRLSENTERLNPYNSLLLLPTLDKLFDKGDITFETNGKIRIYENINPTDLVKAHVSKDLALRSVPADLKKFLEFHQEYVFGLGKPYEEDESSR